MYGRPESGHDIVSKGSYCFGHTRIFSIVLFVEMYRGQRVDILRLMRGSTAGKETKRLWDIE